MALRRLSVCRNNIVFNHGVNAFLPVKYPSWEYSEPCGCPDQEEDSEDDITGSVELGVVEHLGQLQEYVGAVVGEQHQGATPGTGGNL